MNKEVIKFGVGVLGAVISGFVILYLYDKYQDNKMQKVTLPPAVDTVG